MMGFAQWLADFRWAMNMMRARRFRREIGFAQRIRFDAAFRPRLASSLVRAQGVKAGDPVRIDVIDYPDAPYHITVDDLIRGIRAAATYPYERKP